MSWLNSGPPLRDMPGWKAVGDPRLEWGAPNTSADFDLLLIESVLNEAGIPCQFLPHRPNEGYFQPPAMIDAVALYVPEERWEEAERLVGEFLQAPIEWGEAGSSGEADEP